MNSALTRWMMAGSVLLLLAMVGCNDAPTAPAGATATMTAPVTMAPPDEPIQLCARIAVADHNRRMLLLEGHPDTIFALQNCQITMYRAGNDATIPFDSLKGGDSCQVNGSQKMDGNIYAYKIRVCSQSGNAGFDEAFRDTILSVDYAAGSFMVVNHAEVILVDENTQIWGVIKQWQNQEGGHKGEQPLNNADFGGYESAYHEMTLSLADLQPGDVVEVRANRIDESTLLAVYVKLANCETRQQCITFESTISTIDASARIVTFTDNTWIGWVCPKAKLTDADGLPLTLADFAAGEGVAVKGVPLTGDTLRICSLTKLPVM